jgi:PAS domain S-box-containing protein
VRTLDSIAKPMQNFAPLKPDVSNRPRDRQWRAARFVLLSGSVMLIGAVLLTSATLSYMRNLDEARDEKTLTAALNPFVADVSDEILLIQGGAGAEKMALVEAAAQRYAEFSDAEFVIVQGTKRLLAASAAAREGDLSMERASLLIQQVPSGDMRATIRDAAKAGGKSNMIAIQRIELPGSPVISEPLWALAVTRDSVNAHHAQHQTIAWVVAGIFSVAMLSLMVWLARRYAHSERDAELARQALDVEMKYRDLIEAQQIVKCGSWVTDSTLNNFFPSLEYLNIFKLTAQTCPKTIDEVIAQMVHPSHQEAARENMKRILAGESYEGTRRVRLRDGTDKWLLFRAEPRHDAAGKVIGHRGIVIDISSQQIAELRVAEGEKRYRLITENATDIVSLHDREGRVLYCSPSIRKAFGYDPIKSVGVPAFALVHHDDRRDLAETLKALFDGEVETATTMCRFRNASGQYRWLESVVAPVSDPLKGFQHYQVVSRDVTRRQEALLALHASEERFRSLTELSADWYWEQDSEYRFTFISKAPPAAENVISQALIGHNHWDAFPNALGREAWDAHRADLAARNPFQNLIVEISNPETNRVSYYSLSGRPVFDAKGKFIGYRGTGRDITARHLTELSLARRTHELAQTNAALEEEVLSRQRLERDFLLAIEMELAQIGLELHDDLGQDLTGIALLTSALSRKLREQGHPGNAEAARISELVNRTIKHTRMISHGLSPYIWGSTGLVAALKQLASDIDTLGVTQCETSLEQVDIADEIVARSLYRIAQESVNNALKHSQASRITISLHAKAGGVELIIRDNGRGSTAQAAAIHATTQPGDRKFHSIRHRASAIGADLSIGDTNAEGTTICVYWKPASAATTANAAE